MKTTDPPIKVHVLANSGINEAWNAISKHDEMIQWYFEDIPEFKTDIGFKTEFPVHNEGRTFTHTWTIKEVSAPNRLTYNWYYPEYSGDADVTFGIEQMGDQVKIEVSMKILKDFESDIPEFKRESCVGGWEYFLGRLKVYLENR